MLPEHLSRWREVVPRSEFKTVNPNKDSYYHQARRAGTKQRYGFELTTPRLSYERAVEFSTYFEALNFDLNRFELPNPLRILGEGGGTPQTRELVSKDSTSIPIEMLPANVTGVWKVGDVIRFANHPKVYKVTALVNSNGSGQSTAQIYPALYANVPNGTSIAFGNDVTYQCELETELEDITFAVSNSKMPSITIHVIEVG